MKLSMPRFDQAPVLVVGDVMLDRYWHGGTSRISPEAPVPVVKVEQIEDRPGGAANVALNIAALGAPASLVGVTGEDEAAESLANSLKAAGVTARFQRIAHQPTIVKLRVMSRHQQLLRIDFEEPFATDALALSEIVDNMLDGIKVLVLSDYGKGALKNHQVLIGKHQHLDPVEHVVDDFTQRQGVCGEGLFEIDTQQLLVTTHDPQLDDGRLMGNALEACSDACRFQAIGQTLGSLVLTSNTHQRSRSPQGGNVQGNVRGTAGAVLYLLDLDHRHRRLR